MWPLTSKVIKFDYYFTFLTVIFPVEKMEIIFYFLCFFARLKWDNMCELPGTMPDIEYVFIWKIISVYWNEGIKKCLWAASPKLEFKLKNILWHLTMFLSLCVIIIIPGNILLHMGKKIFYGQSCQNVHSIISTDINCLACCCILEP